MHNNSINKFIEENLNRTNKVNYTFISSIKDKSFDFVKIKSICSFGKLKVIQACDATDAVIKIKDKCGSKGYIANLVLDDHHNSFGEDVFGPNNIPKALSAFKDGGMIGEASVVLLGQCKAGLDDDFASQLSIIFGGAKVYANMSYSSSMSFLFRSTFSGYVRITKGDDKEYYRRKSAICNIGYYNVGTAAIQVVTNHIVKLRNSGRIVETSKSYSEKKRERLYRKYGIEDPDLSPSNNDLHYAPVNEDDRVPD